MKLVLVIVIVSVALALMVPGPAVAPGPNAPVTVAGFSFTPAVLVVPVGSTVTWTGALFPHTVTTDAGAVDGVLGNANDASNSDGNPDTFSANLPQGSTFSHTFNSAGEFHYHCTLHHSFGMVGVIVVVSATP